VDDPTTSLTERVRASVADALRRVGPPESSLERVLVSLRTDDRSDEAA
jgi:hypothetical protein